MRALPRSRQWSMKSSTVRAAQLAPPGLVGLAEQMLLDSRSTTCRTAAGTGPWSPSETAGPSAAQAAGSGLPRADQAAAVPHAQPETAGAVTASAHRAGGQLDPSVQRWPRIGQERRQVRAPRRPPTVAVAAAEPVLPPGPVAPGTEHSGRPSTRSSGIRQIDLDPELRADRGHQLAQQPAAGRCRVTRLGGHNCTSRPVNQPAASNARRASSTVR